MIVKMLKYQFVLFSGECEKFVESLCDLGMVDITTSRWEASMEDQALIVSIEAHDKAVTNLTAFIQSERFVSSAVAYGSGEEAFASYSKTSGEVAAYEAEIERLKATAREVKPWGEFSAEALTKLSKEGVVLNYFVALESDYEAIEAERGGDLALSVISREDGKIYFVAVTREGDGADLNLDAQMVKPLTASATEIEQEIKRLEQSREALNSDLSRAAKSIELIKQHKSVVVEQLQQSRVSSSAEQAAEGSLLVMEGWAEEATAAKVDALLDAQSGLVYFKSRPTPSDNTPVKLENNSFAKLFEMVSNLYALPKYGTIDLTPLFAPFYMLFFAICLCDAGYGAMILAAGLFLRFKGGESMRSAGMLTILCGATAVIFGFLANSIFGMEFSSMPLFESFRFINFQKDFFVASMAIGIVQILFGMLIKISVTTRSFGFKYAVGSVGWFIMVLTGVASLALPAVGVELPSVLYQVGLYVGLALLIFFNNPEKNIFANIGSGIWEAYDRTTGLMGDVLSYIRLFAIGLSGGVLALVFNDLAVGMTGLDVSWADQTILELIPKLIGATAILLVGHGINLFMSTISSFVHPMRLTFVEFYKNAGFEMATRKFEPLNRG
ncbi:MAG: V-type ATPase 116kDa subunit family protein [Rikenellaceae bacterium]